MTRDEAIAQGLNFYDGRPCNFGHAAKRYVKSRVCAECGPRRYYTYVESRRTYFKKPSVMEKSRIRCREWLEKNKDRNSANGKRWRTKNHEKKLTDDRAYKAARREELAAKAREYYKNNPEAAIAAARRRGEKLVKDGTITRETVRLLIAKYPLCPYCDVDLNEDNRHFDHKEPLVRGGPHTLSNLIPCCEPCNRRKRATPFREWLKRIGREQIAL